MVVELIANMPPRKMQLIFDHPKRCPARMPMVIMQKTMVIVAMMGAYATLGHSFGEWAEDHTRFLDWYLYLTNSTMVY